MNISNNNHFLKIIYLFNFHSSITVKCVKLHVQLVQIHGSLILRIEKYQIETTTYMKHKMYSTQCLLLDNGG